MYLKSTTRTAVSLAFAVALSGCSVFEKSEMKPLVHRAETAVTEMDVYALKATHRLAYSQVYRARGERRLRRMCSEPPPDVASALLESLAGKLNASTSSKLTSGEIDASSYFATSVSEIYTRSQAVQVLRDGSFMLCQAYLNSAVQADVIRAEAQEKRQEAARLTDEDQEKARLLNEVKALEIKAGKNETDAALNYSNQLAELLKTTNQILEKEIPELYKYKIEETKRPRLVIQASPPPTPMPTPTPPNTPEENPGDKTNP